MSCFLFIEPRPSRSSSCARSYNCALVHCPYGTPGFGRSGSTAREPSSRSRSVACVAASTVWAVSARTCPAVCRAVSPAIFAVRLTAEDAWPTDVRVLVEAVFHTESAARRTVHTTSADVSITRRAEARVRFKPFDGIDGSDSSRSSRRSVTSFWTEVSERFMASGCPRRRM